MPRKNSGPWHWTARGGWYATVRRRRYHLLDGPRDDKHAALAREKYDAIKSPPPGVDPAAVAEMVRRAREEGFAAGGQKGFEAGKKRGAAVGREDGIALGRAEGAAVGREDGIAIGRMAELVHGIDWWRMLRDQDAESVQDGVAGCIDLNVLATVGVAGMEEAVSQATTAADAEAVLLNVGVIQSGTAAAGHRAIPGLRRLLGLYPL